MNFVNWRQLARVMRAMEWLAAGKPVGWIALSCGYSSVSAFIEVFRAWTGKTPGQWVIKEGPFGRR
ncbi:helix-turn-helix domain-containing protein [Enterobacter kobei]|nr:helix-turn-helix domain-containing protein [Enterobacter kobei]MCK7334546.1 helix-turn-helix domain-containing protein [Enterobacter kobei]